MSDAEPGSAELAPNTPQIKPYRLTPARCVAFDPLAERAAAFVAGMLRGRCPDVVVEHVGSTAVPGCAGKGIVDLVAIYPQGQLAETRAAIDALGFQRQTFGHPFPEERPMRVATLRWRGRDYRVHVHVVAAGSPEVEALLRFRDRLRNDPALTAAYVERKRALIDAGVVDPRDYSEAKGDFINAALAEGTRADARGGSPESAPA